MVARAKMKVVRISLPPTLLQVLLRADMPYDYALELIQHPPIRRMLTILDFDPVLRPADPITPIRTLRHNALKSHVACRREQVGTDVALVERTEKNSIRPPRF